MTNNQDIKISIIVPIYNAEKYIDRCMRSIYSQTFSDYEIILVNDGSKDNSANICKAYAEKDKRITFIDKENGGAGSARNAGLNVAKGEYIAFPDVDDWFEPEMYAELYDLAKSGGYDMVFSGANNYSQSLEKLDTLTCKKAQYNTQEECIKNIMTFFPTTTIFDVPWNKLYKRETVEKNGIRFTDLKRCQDAVFNMDVYFHSNSVISTDKAYYNYLNNETAEVNRKFPKNYIDIAVSYYTHLKELFISHGIYEGKIKEHYDSSFVIAVISAANMYDNATWKLSRREKKVYVYNVLNKKEVFDFLQDVTVREDVKPLCKIIADKDVKKLMKMKRKEKFKNFLRKNKLIAGVYHLVKGKKND